MRETNSGVNSRIKQKFVDREVFCCLTGEVEYILRQSQDGDRNAPFCEDDIENYWVPYCKHCGDGYTDIRQTSFDMLTDAQKFDFKYQHDLDENDDLLNYEGEETFICHDCGYIFTAEEHDELNSECAEPYEWWAVTHNLYDSLKQFNEVVLEGPLVHYWGRKTTGQVIALDGIIDEICEDWQIFEDQEHSWAKEV